MPWSSVDTEYSISRVQDTPMAVYTKYSIRQVQHILSTVHTKYSTHRVQYTPSIVYTQCSKHQVQYTPSTVHIEYSKPRVQHTMSTAYNNSCVHRVWHTPSTASSQDCFSSLYSHYCKLTPECSIIIRHASQYNYLPSACSSCSLKDNVSLSHSRACKLTNWWIESQQLERHPSPGTKHWSIFPRSCRRSVSLNLINLGLQVCLQTRSIRECKLARSWPPSVFPNSLNYSLHVHISQWAWLQFPSVFTISPNCGLPVHTIIISKCRCPKLLDHGLQVYLQPHTIIGFTVAQSWLPSANHHTPLIAASMCISELPWSGLQVCTIMASKCISELAWSWPQSISLSSLDHHFEVYFEFLSSTTCSQSRYSVCRWVAV